MQHPQLLKYDFSQVFRIFPTTNISVDSKYYEKQNALNFNVKLKLSAS